MITVNYLDGVDNIRCDEHLFQWDNGQKLCLSGLNTYVSNLETVDVHFCNKISKLAITVKPTVVSNNIVAPIPNSLLQDPYPIIAYFYVPSDNGSRTIVMVTIPIEPKKRPSDFILNEDEAIASLDAINNKVNATLNNITVDYNNFKTNIEAELRDIVENLELEDAKTLQSHPASDFVLKTEIPTSLPANGGNADTVDNKHYTDFSQNAVLSSMEQVNDPNLESGIYSAENVSMSFSSDVASNWFMLIVNKHRVSAGYGTQIAIPYDNGEQRGTFYRICHAGNWGNWKNIADGGNADTVDNKHASDFVLKTEIPTSLPANGGNADYAVNADVANTVKNPYIIGTNLTPDILYHTILDWANNTNGFCTASIIDGAGFPPDLPINHEGLLTLETCYQGLRKVLTFTSFYDVGLMYQRTIFNKEWISDWCQTKSGNADTVDNKHANDFSQNRVLTTIDEVNDANLESGIYSVEGVPITLPCGTFSYITFIVNHHRTTPGFGTQIAIPYDGGIIRGVYYRLASNGVWSDWKNIADGGNAIHADNANYATTAGDASTVNGVKLIVGTREPQCEEPNALAYVPEGAWYGQY